MSSVDIEAIKLRIESIISGLEVEKSKHAYLSDRSVSLGMEIAGLSRAMLVILSEEKLALRTNPE